MSELTAGEYFDLLDKAIQDYQEWLTVFQETNRILVTPKGWIVVPRDEGAAAKAEAAK